MTDMPMAGGSPQDSKSVLAKQGKRKRIQLSCTTCREKKLKCNRAEPCDQCEKRDISAGCFYLSNPNSRTNHHGSWQVDANLSQQVTMPPRVALPSPRSSLSEELQVPELADMSLGTRIRHLESALAALKQQQAESQAGSESAQLDSKNSFSSPPSSPDLAAATAVGEGPSMDGATWESIHDDIVSMNLADDLTDDERDDDLSHPDTHAGMPRRGPILLIGAFRHVSIGSILRHLPSRDLLDLLVREFFESKSMASTIFHEPTFVQDYEAFWRNPTKATYSYLALLFLMIANAILFCHSRNRVVRKWLIEAPPDFIDTCHHRAAQCLGLGNYTRPGRYKMEALMMYFSIEYLRRTDGSLGSSMILAIVSRLGMQMGYHIEGGHLQKLSVFEAEMRRRLWAQLIEVDRVVAFALGLPSMISTKECSTLLPRNLLDTDLYPGMKKLPPSRPESETGPTPLLNLLCRLRLMAVFQDAIDAAKGPHKVILGLDRRLAAAYGTLSPPMRCRPTPNAPDPLSSDPAPADILMQRSLLDIIYQRARCVMHRRYLPPAHSDPTFAYSRRVCVEAALRILHYQRAFHEAMQPGGRFEYHRWLLNSSHMNDFLFGGMMLCLDISLQYKRQRQQQQRQAPSAGQVPESATASVAQLVDAVRTSRNIWKAQRGQFPEAVRGFKTLSRMLACWTRDSDTDASSPEDMSPLEAHPAYTSMPSVPEQFAVPAPMQVLTPAAALGPANIPPPPSATWMPTSTVSGMAIPDTASMATMPNMTSIPPLDHSFSAMEIDSASAEFSANPDWQMPVSFGGTSLPMETYANMPEMGTHMAMPGVGTNMVAPGVPGVPGIQMAGATTAMGNVAATTPATTAAMNTAHSDEFAFLGNDAEQTYSNALPFTWNKFYAPPGREHR